MQASQSITEVLLVHLVAPVIHGFESNIFQHWKQPSFWALTFYMTLCKFCSSPSFPDGFEYYCYFYTYCQTSFRSCAFSTNGPSFPAFSKAAEIYQPPSRMQTSQCWTILQLSKMQPLQHFTDYCLPGLISHKIASKCSTLWQFALSLKSNVIWYSGQVFSQSWSRKD